MTLMQVLVLVGAYGLGSVSFAFLLVRNLRGIDLRTVGSGNLGATNAGRVLGRKFAVLIYLLDFLKGFAPVALVRWGLGNPLVLGTLSIPLALLAGLAAFIGHCYPVWHQFRGGKGVATASGLILAIAPLVGGLVLVVFGIVLKVFRMVSLGSIVAALALPVAYWALEGEVVFHRPGAWTFGLFTMLAAWVVIRHHQNVRRILRGEEPKVGGKRA